MNGIYGMDSDQSNIREHEALTERIIGASFEVYNTLGYGFLESVYERSLEIELRRLNLQVQSQLPITVQYKGESVGDFVADMVIEDKVLVELKSIRTLAQTHDTTGQLSRGDRDKCRSADQFR